MGRRKIVLPFYLSVILLGFLLNTSLIRIHNIEAIDRSDWSWGAPEVISDFYEESSMDSSLAVDDWGDLHIAYTAYLEDDWNIVYKKKDMVLYTWLTAKIVSSESFGESSYPSLAVDSLGNVHIAWAQSSGYGNSGDDNDIFYRQWNDASEEWTTTEVISIDSDVQSSQTSIAVDAMGNVHVIWVDSWNIEGIVYHDILYRRWEVASEGWTTTEIVSTDKYDRPNSPALAVDKQGNVHFTWTAFTYKYNDVFYRRWEATSEEWSSIEIITEKPGDGYNPTITVDKYLNVHIAFTFPSSSIITKSVIMYKKWDATSEEWLDREIATTENEDRAINPSLVADSNGNLHLTWREIAYSGGYGGSGDDTDIFYKQWESISRKWTTIEVVSTESEDSSYHPSLAVDSSGNVHIAWDDEFEYLGKNDIFYKRRNAFWEEWTNTEEVSKRSIWDSKQPEIAIDNWDNLHIVWEDLSSNVEEGMYNSILYRKWDKTSTSWTPIEIVSKGYSGNTKDPSLAVDAVGNVHIVWVSGTDILGAGIFDTDIFYKRWDATLSDWTNVELVSVGSLDYSHDPTIDVDDSGNIHIAWKEEYDPYYLTDDDILYRRWDASISDWISIETVSTESSGHKNNPSLDADSLGNVHIVWRDDADYSNADIDADIFYKRWDATLSDWTITEVVSTESNALSEYPSLITDSLGNIHVVWNDQTDHNNAGIDDDIFYKRWDATLSDWTVTEVVSTESTIYSYKPSIAVDSSDEIHIVWEDWNPDNPHNPSDIFYKRWDATLSDWTAAELVSIESTGYSRSPSIAVDSLGRLHVTWDDNTDLFEEGLSSDIFGSSFDIFYKVYDYFPPIPTPTPTASWNFAIISGSFAFLAVLTILRKRIKV